MKLIWFKARKFFRILGIEKIDISYIVQDHISTLKNYQTNKISQNDIVLFYVAPLLFSIILVYLQFKLNKELLTILVTSLSIFAALLFNLLLLVYDIFGKISNVINDTDKDLSKKMQLLKEVYANISYCILIAIITIILLVFFALNIPQMFNMPQIEVVGSILTIIVFWLLIQFIFTLLMILKRVHELLMKDFKNKSNVK